jgi:U6 snRNA phosphodiesterase
MLVAYSDSESDEQSAPRVKKRKIEAVTTPGSRNGHASPPPPPAAFHSLYATNVRGAVADDPSLHGGRTRQVAHVEGNWPTHVYLEWLPSKSEVEVLEDVIESCSAIKGRNKGHVHSLLRSDLNVQLPLHISLSAPLTLKTDTKDDFATAITDEVGKCDASKFTVSPSSLAWVSNYENTRSFLVLKLNRPGNDELNKILAACNKCAGRYGQHLLYAKKQRSKVADELEDLSAAFHISIAWSLGAAEDVGEQVLVPAELLDKVRGLDICFEMVKLKMGNTITDIKLLSQHR